MQASAIRRSEVRAPQTNLSDAALPGQPTSRTIPVMVSAAEYQRLRGARQRLPAAREPLDPKLVKLLDECDSCD